MNGRIIESKPMTESEVKVMFGLSYSEGVQMIFEAAPSLPFPVRCGSCGEQLHGCRCVRPGDVPGAEIK